MRAEEICSAGEFAECVLSGIPRSALRSTCIDGMNASPEARTQCPNARGLGEAAYESVEVQIRSQL